MDFFLKPDGLQGRLVKKIGVNVLNESVRALGSFEVRQS